MLFKMIFNGQVPQKLLIILGNHAVGSLITQCHRTVTSEWLLALLALDPRAHEYVYKPITMNSHDVASPSVFKSPYIST